MVSYRHFTLKWRNPDGKFLYSDYFMHMPYDIVTISSVVVLYGLVIREIRKTNRTVAGNAEDAAKRQVETLSFLFR